MAYGTVIGVEGYSSAVTDKDGKFTSSTVPKLSHVENWLAQVSAIMDTALAQEGFTTPITEATSLLAVTTIVEQLVTDLVMWANRAGRFYTERAQQVGVSPWRIITQDVRAWVDTNAPGLEANGASRSSSAEDEVGFRATDEAGDNLFPIFQRKGFGNEFTDWTNG